MGKKRGLTITFLVIFFAVGFGGIAIQKGLINIPDASVKEEEKGEEDKGENITTLDYKSAVEDYITKELNLTAPSFSIGNYREWEDGAGFVMAENTYEVNKVSHKYVARIGKDNKVYKLIIDDKVYSQADADTILEYMQEYAE